MVLVVTLLRLHVHGQELPLDKGGRGFQLPSGAAGSCTTHQSVRAAMFCLSVHRPDRRCAKLHCTFHTAHRPRGAVPLHILPLPVRKGIRFSAVCQYIAVYRPYRRNQSQTVVTKMLLYEHSCHLVLSKFSKIAVVESCNFTAAQRPVNVLSEKRGSRPSQPPFRNASKSCSRYPNGGSLARRSVGVRGLLRQSSRSACLG